MPAKAAGKKFGTHWVVDTAGLLMEGRFWVPTEVIPKYRLKALYGSLRRLAQQKESEIEEGHLTPDHVHMMISIPPTYALAQVVEYIKRKSAIHIRASLWREAPELRGAAFFLHEATSNPRWAETRR